MVPSKIDDISLELAGIYLFTMCITCLLYTSDAADE